MDLYPKSVNRNRLKAWIERHAKEYGIKPVDTLLVSGHKRIQIDELLRRLTSTVKGKMHIVG